MSPGFFVLALAVAFGVAGWVTWRAWGGRQTSNGAHVQGYLETTRGSWTLVLLINAALFGLGAAVLLFLQ